MLPATAATIHVPADRRTIQDAAAKAKPGDVVLVAPGTYNERVKFKKGCGGSEGKPVTFRSEAPREATMKGFDTTGANFLIIEGFTIVEGDGVFVGSDNIEVTGNYFHDFAGSAVRATQSHDNITIRNNRAFRCQRGFMVKGKKWTVEDNEVEKLIYTNGEPDYVDFFGQDLVFRRNKFFGTLESDIGPGHVDCFQTFAEGVQNCIIEENYCSGMHQGVLLEADKPGGTRGIIIRNNMFIEPWSWGILMKRNSEAVIENNLIYNSGIHGIGIRQGNNKPDDGGSVAKCRGNIIVGGKSYIWGEDRCKLDSDYNLGFSIRNKIERGRHDLVANPKFKDPPRDFTLLPDSPALHAAEDGGNLGPKMIWPKSE